MKTISVSPLSGAQNPSGRTPCSIGPGILFFCFIPLATLIAQDIPPPVAADAAASAGEALPDTFTPSEYPIDRYQKLRGKSPFEFELAKPVVEAAADPFADLVLAGYAGSASRPTVYVVNTKTQERLTILPQGSGAKDPTGYKVLSVNRGRNLATTTVKIEKDGVQKELAFDPKALSSMTAGATGGQPGSAPGARPGMPGQPMQPGQPGQPNRPAIPGQQPVAAYKAPAAFIPNANNRGAGQMNNPMNNPMANNGIQLGMQPGQTAPPAGATDAQVQLNNLLNNAAGAGAPPAVIPTPGSQNGQPVQQQPRRRVVLPTAP